MYGFDSKNSSQSEEHKESEVDTVKELIDLEKAEMNKSNGQSHVLRQNLTETIGKNYFESYIMLLTI